MVERDGISFASEHVRSFWLWLYVRPQQRWLRLGKKHTHTHKWVFTGGDEVILYPGSKKQCKTCPTFCNHLPNILLKSLKLVCNFFKISVEPFLTIRNFFFAFMRQPSILPCFLKIPKNDTAHMHKCCKHLPGHRCKLQGAMLRKDDGKKDVCCTSFCVLKMH